MSIQRFEDLDAWKESRNLTRNIYEITTKIKDYGLRDQIQRSSVSVMANIAEGFASQSDAQFSKYLFISLASANEVQSHLYVLLDQQHLNENQFKKLYDQATKTIQIIRGLIRYLKSKK